MILLVVAVLLILVGGGIAYAGDRIGSYVGKKRLSVFKLRPRDTARFFTISAGSIIALVSFFTLYGMNKNFQIALQHGVELINRNRELTRVNEGLSAAANQAQVQLGAAEVQRQTEQTQLQTVNSQLKTARTSVATADKKLMVLQTKLLADESQVTKLQQHALVLIAANAQASYRLNQEYSQLKNRSEGTLLYRSEQEVGRCVIESGQSIYAIRAQVYAFLSRLGTEAKSGGALGVQIAPFGYKPSVVIGQSGNVNALAQVIHDSPVGKVAVIAVALGNAYAGGQVIVRLHPYVDHLVIPEGTELAKLTIPIGDSQSLPRILSDLQSLLETARSHAIRAGVIPVANPQIKQAEIGEVPFAELYQVADQIRNSNGPAVVIVTAQRDTYSSDPLALRFTVNGNDIRPV
jgi:uncharacterized protein (DUF3084 family)